MTYAFFSFKKNFKSKTLLVSGLFLLAFLFIIYFPYASYCAFTWGKFTLSDYGEYTNTIWNCGHGQPFRYLINETYLGTHLSFTLFLIGPFFGLWDHPFLLVVIQWMQLVIGAGFIWKIARTKGFSSEISAALLLFYIANPFTQSVMLSEYHGVSLYFLLMPWLYDCLSRKNIFAWAPALLLLGVREETGIIITPFILYFAFRFRWKGAFFLAVFSFIYSVIAIKILFPLLGEISYVQRRGQVLSLSEILRAFSGSEIWGRVKPLLGYLMLGIFFFRRKGWLPLILFPGISIFCTFTSGYSWISRQESHYPANHIVLFTLALIEAMSLRMDSSSKPLKGKSFWNNAYHAYIIVMVVLIWHVLTGFLPLGANHNRIYRFIYPNGRDAFQAASYLPKKGILLTEDTLAGFCANRADLMTWDLMSKKKYEPDIIFTRLKYVKDHLDEYRCFLKSRKWGVSYNQNGYLILEKGYSTSQNKEAFKEIFPEMGIEWVHQEDNTK